MFTLSRVFVIGRFHLVRQMAKQSKASGHWSNGLVASMEDPELVVISTDTAVVIKDKYPKAKHHFLVLPKQKISSIYQLDSSHVDLLDELELLAINAIELTGRDMDEFQLGYHASPSMQRLHLHVISRDLDSRCLKTKVHWNSFTTDFFLKMIDVHTELRNTGKVVNNSAKLKECLKLSLRCNRCWETPTTMPELRNHIVGHRRS